MRMGIVGSGKIGGFVGTSCSRTGHEVLCASRHLSKLDGLVQAAGNGARRGTPDEAIEFSEVILLSIPFVDGPEFGRSRRVAHCDGPRIGIPLASDDAEAMDVAVQLVRDAGFDPAVVGDLSQAREFDYGTRTYASDMTGEEVRGVLGGHVRMFRFGKLQ